MPNIPNDAWTTSDPLLSTAPLLLTVPEAAKALSIGRSKAYELISSGVLEVVHIGRCCRVPVDAVAAYIRALRRQPDVTSQVPRTIGVSAPGSSTAPDCRRG